MTDKDQSGLPRSEVLRDAIDMYLARAYPDGVSEQISRKFTVPDDCDLGLWLLETAGEAEPPGSDIDSVRTIALRLGNAFYPNMKLNMVRPPGSKEFLLMVDSHDVMLKAPEGSPDYQALEELKTANAAIVADVTSAWDAAAMPTERNYLRDKIRQARERS
ncbi:MAG: hypothetical protein GY794_02455 [bacterium]|nr:hypothetical protein [bacterium]